MAAVRLRDLDEDDSPLERPGEEEAVARRWGLSGNLDEGGRTRVVRDTDACAIRPRVPRACATSPLLADSPNELLAELLLLSTS